MLKILKATIKTIDSKNHVHIFSKNQIDLESIKFLAPYDEEKVSKLVKQPEQPSLVKSPEQKPREEKVKEHKTNEEKPKKEKKASKKSSKK